MDYKATRTSCLSTSLASSSALCILAWLKPMPFTMSTSICICILGRNKGTLKIFFFFFFTYRCFFIWHFLETVHVSFLLVRMVLPILKMDARAVSLPTSILILDNDVCGINLLLNLKRFFYFPLLENTWKWAENKYFHPIQT